MRSLFIYSCAVSAHALPGMVATSPCYPELVSGSLMQCRNLENHLAREMPK
jgi:hypothetical protein